jgi:hypothetical protein
MVVDLISWPCVICYESQINPLLSVGPASLVPPNFVSEALVEAAHCWTIRAVGMDWRPKANTFLLCALTSATELSLNRTRYALASQDSVGFMRAKKIQIMQRVVNDVD